MSGISISIPRDQLRLFDNWVKKKNGEVVSKVKVAMQAARLEMESVAKLTVNEAGLIDTGRLETSLIPQTIDNGYGIKLFVDLRDVESPRTGSKSGAAAGVLPVVNYAVYHEPRVKFMEKSLEAAKVKFLKRMAK